MAAIPSKFRLPARTFSIFQIVCEAAKLREGVLFSWHKGRKKKTFSKICFWQVIFHIITKAHLRVIIYLSWIFFSITKKHWFDDSSWSNEPNVFVPTLFPTFWPSGEPFAPLPPLGFPATSSAKAKKPVKGKPIGRAILMNVGVLQRSEHVLNLPYKWGGTF